MPNVVCNEMPLYDCYYLNQQYSEHCYSKLYYAKCHFAECRYYQCHYPNCYSANFDGSVFFSSFVGEDFNKKRFLFLSCFLIISIQMKRSVALAVPHLIRLLHLKSLLHFCANMQRKLKCHLYNAIIKCNVIMQFYSAKFQRNF